VRATGSRGDNFEALHADSALPVAENLNQNAGAVSLAWVRDLKGDPAWHCRTGNQQDRLPDLGHCHQDRFSGLRPMEPAIALVQTHGSL